MRPCAFKWAERATGAMLLLVGISIAKPPACTMKAQTIQSDSRHFTLVVTYPKQCEVSMDSQPERIVLSVARSGGAYVLPKPTRTQNRPPSYGSLTADETHTITSLIRRARSKIGARYVYSATGPDHFDCSGFVYYLFRSEGIAIPRTSHDQSQMGTHLTRAQLRRGDLVFFDTGHRGHVNHSGLYLGGGRFVHATSGKAYGVTTSRLDHGFYDQAFRWGIRVIGPQPQTTHPHTHNTADVSVPQNRPTIQTISTSHTTKSKTKTTPKSYRTAQPSRQTKTHKSRTKKHRRNSSRSPHKASKNRHKKMTLKEGVDRLLKSLKHP